MEQETEFEAGECTALPTSLGFDYRFQVTPRVAARAVETTLHFGVLRGDAATYEAEVAQHGTDPHATGLWDVKEHRAVVQQQRQDSS
jgi:hypothetical protein